MKKTTLCLFFFLLTTNLNFSFSQCKEEIINYDNGIYNGCVNYEGEKHGNGILTLNLSTQTQIQNGKFTNDNFISGVLTVNFNTGDSKIVNYVDYQSDIIETEIYKWSNGDKLQTFYENGIKVREVNTYGPGDSEGLIVKKFFSNNDVVTIRNTDNNRVEEDIVGDKDYTDIKLIERDNQFRINIGFPTKDGDVMNVPIQFDSGATSFFIGYILYQDLLLKCEIEDMNVEGISGGVGSEFKTKYIKIDKLLLGDYIVKNVIAVVPLREDINDLLIGVGFLKKFNEVLWSLNSNLMRFYR